DSGTPGGDRDDRQEPVRTAAELPERPPRDGGERRLRGGGGHRGRAAPRLSRTAAPGDPGDPRPRRPGPPRRGLPFRRPLRGERLPALRRRPLPPRPAGRKPPARDRRSPAALPPPPHLRLVATGGRGSLPALPADRLRELRPLR